MDSPARNQGSDGPSNGAGNSASRGAGTNDRPGAVRPRDSIRPEAGDHGGRASQSALLLDPGASDQERWNLFDGYVHGPLGRRGFLDAAGKFVVRGMTAAMLLDVLKPLAEAQQIKPNDKRLEAGYQEIAWPQGTGKLKGYLPVGSLQRQSRGRRRHPRPRIAGSKLESVHEASHWHIPGEHIRGEVPPGMATPG